MKHILFIRTHDKNVHRAVIHPLGSLYLSAMIRREFGQEFRVRILHTGLYKHPLEVLRQTVTDFPPDYVVMTALTPEINFIRAITRIVKQMVPQCKMLLGGPYPTSMPEHAVYQKDIDVIGIGEGELTLCELLHTFEDQKPLDKIKGIAYLDRGQIVRTPPREFIQDIDSLPLPAWDLLDFREYGKEINMSNSLRGTRYASIFTSRGCPYRCIYCHGIQGKSFRPRSPESVMEEIQWLHRDFAIDELHIMDDIFNFDRERMHCICQKIIDSGIKLHISFPNGIRTDRLNPEDIDILEAAGVYKLCFAIETRNKRLQRAIHKNNNFEKIDSITAYACKSSILISSFFMLGFPTETYEEIQETVRYAIDSNLDSGAFFQVVPYPGTELYDWALKNNAKMADSFAFKPEQFHFSSGHSATTNLSHKELTMILLTTYLRFYFKPRRFIRLLQKLPNKPSFVRDILIIIKHFVLYCLNMETRVSLNILGGI